MGSVGFLVVVLSLYSLAMVFSNSEHWFTTSFFEGAGKRGLKCGCLVCLEMAG